MKELSIEQKAQRYDEAIEVARKIKNGERINVPDGTLIPVTIFPELKESEDEGMVKFIKQQLFNIKKTITENYELDAKLTKAIDWLEKQGGQKLIWNEEDENIRQWIISDIKKLLALGKKSSIIADKEFEWIKFLEDKYTWKPSKNK